MTATATAPTAPTPASPAGGSLRQSIRDSLTIAKRNLIRMLRIPEVVVFGLFQPIMFVVLFS